MDTFFIPKSNSPPVQANKPKTKEKKGSETPPKEEEKSKKINPIPM